MKHEDISMEVLRVLNALKPLSSEKQAQESKDRIYKLVRKRIKFSDSYKAESKTKFRRLLLYTLSAVSVLAILLVPVSVFFYQHGFGAASELLATSYIDLKIPYGSISHITLPDSSKVTLNGGSSLSYPAVFNKSREVVLTGEAFFDVAKNEKQPFFVHTPNLVAKVLGTKFNIKAYESENTTILTLEEGSIYVMPDKSPEEGVMLKPSQQIIVNNETNETLRRQVDVYEYSAWKDGILIFRDKTLEDISSQLERQFNTNINITTDVLKKECYSAQFKHGENLYQILDKLSYKRGWKYKSANGIIEISFK